MKNSKKAPLLVTVITGASGGIGKELALLSAADKHNLVLIARSRSALIKVAEAASKAGSPQVFTLVQDLSTSTAVERVVEYLQEKNLSAHTLINNAGFGSFGRFWRLEEKVERDEIALNVTALTMLTKRLLPDMIARQRGAILNIASVASFLPGPLMAVYYATKAYVLSFSVALNEELRGTGVTVTAICPGPTETGFSQRAQARHSPLFNGRLATSQEVAATAYRALKNRTAVTVVGFSNNLIVFISRFAPRTWLARVVRKLQETKA